MNKCELNLFTVIKQYLHHYRTVVENRNNAVTSNIWLFVERAQIGPQWGTFSIRQPAEPLPPHLLTQSIAHCFEFITVYRPLCSRLLPSFCSPPVLPLLDAGKGQNHLLIYSLPERGPARRTQYACFPPLSSNFADARFKMATVISVIPGWRVKEVVAGLCTLKSAQPQLLLPSICIFRGECSASPYSRFPLFMPD